MKNQDASEVADAPVRLAISPVAAHVRTARLVGVAVARHVGVPEMLIDEVRLAIGEACTRAVTAHQRARLDSLVELEFSLLESPQRFQVLVRDYSLALPRYVAAEQTLELLDDAEHEDEVGLAVLTGLVDDISIDSVETDGPGTVVQMRWGFVR